MRLKNYIDYKRFPEPYRGDWSWFTILVLSARLTDYQAVRNITPALTPIFGQWSGLFFGSLGMVADGLVLLGSGFLLEFVEFSDIHTKISCWILFRSATL